MAILRQRRSSWKGLVGGMAGGLAATVIMTQFQNGWSKAAKVLSSNDEATPQETQSSNSSEEKEDATMKAASKLAELAGYELSTNGKKRAGTLVHYAFGTLMGGLYGLGMEYSKRRARRVPSGLSGTLFGIGLFLAADELAVPALKFSGKASEAPLGAHIYGLASHLVYGSALEGVQRVLRSRI